MDHNWKLQNQRIIKGGRALIYCSVLSLYHVCDFCPFIVLKIFSLTLKDDATNYWGV